MPELESSSGQVDAGRSVWECDVRADGRARLKLGLTVDVDDSHCPIACERSSTKPKYEARRR
jgi:hypothetical protein